MPSRHEPKRRAAACLSLSAVLLLCCGAPGALRAAGNDWGQAKTVVVVAVEYDFVPNDLHFQRGVAYRLRLENHGQEMHELTAPEFFHSAKIGNPAVLARNGTDLVVQPHETKDLLLIPERAGHFHFYCADHDWAGMTGEITVD